MKNFERYEAEIKEAIEHNNAISVLAKLMNLKCGVVGLYNAINWLYEEYEPFTDDEKVILKNLPSRYKWIARDANGELYVYECAPIELNKHYSNLKGSALDFNYYTHLFKNITFESGPVKFRGDDND
ncbi:hypothetical protein [uncultured Thomasclavelia sp.]|uniref:hypothetical protein n=1 Tax=uncultured Thomasclavelia sp. TaxID=3025759 RepID=UPI002606501E|nr:hypothetical protein [uncultured Thomasclavelia sp.]